MALTQISTGGIKDATVATADIADGAVTTAKIVANAVVADSINAGAVTTAKIQNGAVSTAKIADDSVTDAKIADNAVVTSTINAGAVTTTRIANLAIDASKIASDAITTAKIANSAITSAKLAASSVDSNALGSQVVVTANIADDAITTAKIADGAINTDRIAGSAVTGTRIADGAVTNSKIANDAINSAKIENNTIVNADINSSAAIAGTKIAPNFGSQNIATTGDLECDGEFKPHWIGHQSQCVDNTHNTVHYHKIAEVTGGGSEGGKIEFFGTTDYSGNGTNNQVGRTTLLLRHLTNNQLGGVFWSESGSYRAVHDIRWKYTGSNNVYEIWIQKGQYDNIVPHVTGSFDYVQTFGSSTGSGTAPSGSTAFREQWQCQIGGSNIFTINSGDVIFQNKRMFSASGYANMNVAYSHDATCADDSGHGRFFWVVAGHTHYNNGYGATRVAAVHCRGTGVIYANNLINETSSNGGSWSFSKPNNTTFRVTHNAGSYAYPGRYTITVYSST